MKEQTSVHVERMNELLRDKAQKGVLGVRLLVSPHCDFTRDQVAKEFNHLEELRANAVVRTCVGF